MNGLEEYKDYVYRVDVTDNNNITIGTSANVKTYCSGKGLECPGGAICDYCDGTHKCKHKVAYMSYLNELTFSDAKINCTLCSTEAYWDSHVSGTNILCEGCKTYFANTDIRHDTVTGVSILIISKGPITSGGRYDMNWHMPSNGKNNNYVRQILFEHFPDLVCTKCEPSGRIPCEAHGISDVHPYCAHLTDDENHKWHYTRAE